MAIAQYQHRPSMCFCSGIDSVISFIYILDDTGIRSETCRGLSREYVSVLQIADALQFLHHEANLVHRGVSPGVIILTAAGAWKLAGLGLASRAQFGSSGDSNIVKPFDYRNNSTPAWLQLTQVASSVFSSCLH